MRGTHRVLVGVLFMLPHRRRRGGAAPRSEDYRLPVCGNDIVTKRPRLSHEACRLSCGRIDGVEAVRHRVDAIAATTSC